MVASAATRAEREHEQRRAEGARRERRRRAERADEQPAGATAGRDPDEHRHQGLAGGVPGPAGRREPAGDQRPDLVLPLAHALPGPGADQHERRQAAADADGADRRFQQVDGPVDAGERVGQRRARRGPLVGLRR